MASSHAAKAASVLSRPTKTVVMSLVVNRACIEPSASAHTRTTSESASVPTAFDLGGFKNDARGWELQRRRLSSSRTAGLRRRGGASPRATPHRLQQYREERRRGEYSGPRLSNTRPGRPDNRAFERAFGNCDAPGRRVRGITPPWRNSPRNSARTFPPKSSVYRNGRAQKPRSTKPATTRCPIEATPSVHSALQDNSTRQETSPTTNSTASTAKHAENSARNTTVRQTPRGEGCPRQSFEATPTPVPRSIYIQSGSGVSLDVADV